MTAYALAHLHNPNPHPEVIDYIERIQATFDPYGGCFIVHGPEVVDVREREWPGTVVIIEFPGIDHARGAGTPHPPTSRSSTCAPTTSTGSPSSSTASRPATTRWPRPPSSGPRSGPRADGVRA
jgi:uncharacterized protein (DUF1330 family)